MRLIDGPSSLVQMSTCIEWNQLRFLWYARVGCPSSHAREPEERQALPELAQFGQSRRNTGKLGYVVEVSHALCWGRHPTTMLPLSAARNIWRRQLGTLVGQCTVFQHPDSSPWIRTTSCVVVVSQRSALDKSPPSFATDLVLAITPVREYLGISRNWYFLGDNRDAGSGWLL